MDSLFAELRANPADGALREVVLDHWLEHGDPRSAWGSALRRRDEATATLERQRLVQGPWPAPPRRIRAEAGFVLEVEVHLEDFVNATPRAPSFDAHPLAIVTLRIPSQREVREGSALTPDKLDDAWTRFVLACGSVYGLRLLDVGEWSLPLAVEAIQRSKPAVAQIAFVEPIPAPPTSWPWVRDIGLEGITADHVADWLQAVPNAGRIALRSPPRGHGQEPDETLVRAWLDLDRSWREADLRGCDIAARDLARIDNRAAWIRHPHRHLHAAHPLDDPFGDRGHRILSHTGQRRGAVTWSEEVDNRWALSEGTICRWNLDDAPEDRFTHEHPITALLGLPQNLVVGDEKGHLLLRSFGSHAAARGMGSFAKVDGPVLQLACPLRAKPSIVFRTPTQYGEVDLQGRFIALHEESVDGIAALADRVLVARGSVLSGFKNGREIDFGDSITGLAGCPRGTAAVIAGTWVYWLNATQVSWVGRAEPGMSRISIWDDAIAWVERPQGVRLVDLPFERHHLTYPNRYQNGDESLEVADVSLHPDGTLLVVLERGGANLRVGRDLLKLDEHPGEPYRRWIFVHDGDILIAS
ncbi:MAG: hypothetical protein AAGA48_05155 [Myxococcota bacterium]